MQIVLLVLGCWLAIDALLLSGWMLSFRVARRHSHPVPPPLRPTDYPSLQPRRERMLTR